ncbi:MAG TPA: phosphate acyltransferase PlsX [Balneolaceae bacterium]|nr:phosphate acyltransferase PlsX [Balneolaceae bacterium]
MIIAVDAVGGDHYPHNPVEGAIRSLGESSSLEIVLVGPEELITEELSKHEYDEDRIRILHAPEIIGMRESPASAVKTKTNSSITIGLSAYKKGEVDAFVSAGNTGALLAASIFLLGKLEGVIRPTIAATYPTLKGISLLVDAGANLELKPQMYHQFAVMSSIFATEVMGISAPTIGLLNVGEEPEKGMDLHKEVYRLLQEEFETFTGNIEGGDILLGKTDIYLCDGFSGNVLLKFGESIPEILRNLLPKTMKKEGLDEESQKLVYRVITETMKPFNYEHVGGIPFLGVNGMSLVGHGSSSPVAISNMIHNAVNCIENEINRKIVASLNP